MNNYKLDRNYNYVNGFEENRVLRRIIGKFDEIGKRRLSIVYKNGRYVIEDLRGELASDVDIMEVIQKI